MGVSRQRCAGCRVRAVFSRARQGWRGGGGRKEKRGKKKRGEPHPEGSEPGAKHVDRELHLPQARSISTSQPTAPCRIITRCKFDLVACARKTAHREAYREDEVGSLESARHIAA
eukprot:2374918-Rhodomonas_salina.1